jgi:hypothetical protein
MASHWPPERLRHAKSLLAVGCTIDRVQLFSSQKPESGRSRTESDALLLIEVQSNRQMK